MFAIHSALVFGEFPCAFTKSERMHHRPTLESRAEFANMASREMEKEMVAVHVKCGLKHATPEGYAFGCRYGLRS